MVIILDSADKDIDKTEAVEKCVFFFFFLGKKEREIYLANCFIWVTVKNIEFIMYQLAM